MIFRCSTLTVPNEMAYLQAIQSFAREVTKTIGFDKNDQEMILLALEESVSNVIEHAFGPTENASFQIICEPSMTGIRIIIKDKGLPYDPEHVPAYIAGDDIEHIPQHCLGSFIMKKCVDEVSFRNLGKEGKELHLIKHLPKKKITEYHEAIPSGPGEKAPVKETLPGGSHQFEIRLMNPSEAVEVAKLFYRTYGYSYFSDVMYYPERLAELNRSGLITSVVAVSDEGEIAGHIAMVRDKLSDVAAEAARGAVKVNCRGNDLFTRMMENLVSKAKNCGLMGLYGKAVTVHTYSQKMTAHTGYKDCAILLGCSNADIAFKGIAESLPQRGTYIYSFMPLLPLPAASVYLPPHHESILSKIYSHLGLSRNFILPPSDVAVEGYSNMRTKISTQNNTAEIVLLRYGRDCMRMLRHHLRDLCLKKIDQVTLFLDLQDPTTSHMCKQIEKIGFFISGIIPCLHFEDTLMLQYLNNIDLCYSKIKIYSDMTKEMLAYIEERDPNKEFSQK